MLLLLLPTPPSVLLSVGRDGGNGSSASAWRSGSIASDGRPSCSAHSARSLSSAARAAGASGCDGGALLLRRLRERADTLVRRLRRGRWRCAVSARSLAQLQRRLDESRRMCELQCEAAGALLLQQQLGLVAH